MGARPSQFKSGGGFLNGVDGRISGYQFTDEFNGEPFVAGKIPSFDNPKKLVDKPHNLNVLLAVRVDGAEEDTTTTLKAANGYDGWQVSEDGLTVVGVDEEGNELPEKNFGSSAAFSKFITSLCKPASGGLGFPEDRLPEDTINYESIIGTRVRLIQQTDAERTKKFGAKVDKKTGKGYDRKDLVVDAVYELPGEAPVVAPAKKAVGVSKTAPKSEAKPLGAAKKTAAKTAAPSVDIDGLSLTTLLAVLKENGGEYAKAKLSMPVRKALLRDNSREDVVKRLFDDTFYETDDALLVVSYDKATGVITANEQ